MNKNDYKHKCFASYRIRYFEIVVTLFASTHNNHKNCFEHLARVGACVCAHAHIHSNNNSNNSKMYNRGKIAHYQIKHLAGACASHPNTIFPFRPTFAKRDFTLSNWTRLLVFIMLWNWCTLHWCCVMEICSEKQLPFFSTMRNRRWRHFKTLLTVIWIIRGLRSKSQMFILCNSYVRRLPNHKWFFLFTTAFIYSISVTVMMQASKSRMKKISIAIFNLQFTKLMADKVGRLIKLIQIS